MNIHTNDPPRQFTTGADGEVTMRDCAAIGLSPDEQITLTTGAGGQYDVARKSWGYYATPSINGRLVEFGFRTALARNRLGRFFVMLIEQGKECDFERYLNEERMTLCGWLDDRTLPAIERALASADAACGEAR